MATSCAPPCLVPGHQYDGDYVPQPVLSETVSPWPRYGGPLVQGRVSNLSGTGVELSQAAFDMVHCARALARNVLVVDKCRVRLFCCHCGAELHDGEDGRRHLANEGVSMLATFEKPKASQLRKSGWRTLLDKAVGPSSLQWHKSETGWRATPVAEAVA